MLNQIYFFTSLLILLTVSNGQNISNLNSNAKYFLDLQKEVNSFGYDLNLHTVTTDDGYVLKLFRIKTLKASNLIPILLLHGFVGCADAWFLKKNQSLPFLLSNEGFDVWIFNSRGTLHSIDHLWFKSNSKNYWTYSFQEIGQYDISATIDYVLKNNIHPKLSIVAHSSGTTQLFSLLSSKPEYNAKVALSINYTPSASFKYFSLDVVRSLCQTVSLIMDVSASLKWYSIWPWGYSSFREFLVEFCLRYGDICTNVFHEIAMDYDQIKHIQGLDIVKRVPCGGSLYEMFHYMQTINNGGTLKYFDHGPVKNLQIYNSTSPPMYDFSKITSPVVLFYATHDEYVTPKDVTYLSTIMPNILLIEPIVCAQWNHLDFILGKDAHKVVYDDSIKLLKKYSNLNMK